MAKSLNVPTLVHLLDFALRLPGTTWETFKELYLSSAPDGKLCFKCGTFLKAKTNMKRHFEERHEVSDIHYFCPICSKEYPHRRAILKHMGYAHPTLKDMDLNKCTYRLP